MTKVKGRSLRHQALKEMKEAGKQGVSSYDLSRRLDIHTSTAKEILDAFVKEGLAKRAETEYRGRIAHTITPLGEQVLGIADTVAKAEKEGKPLTVGELRREYGEEVVGKAVSACLCRFEVPPLEEHHVIIHMLAIETLRVVHSGPVTKYGLVMGRRRVLMGRGT